MNLSEYLEQLRAGLSSAAAFGDEQTQTIAAQLGTAVEPAARLALLKALSDLAEEVTAELDGPVVEVRLDGNDVRVSVTGKPDADTAATEEPASNAPPFRGFGGFGGLGGDAGDISRITLRLVEQIKSQAEQSAADQGVSLNSWIAQAVQGALMGNRGQFKAQFKDQHKAAKREWKAERDERRIRGWVQG